MRTLATFEQRIERALGWNQQLTQRLLRQSQPAARQIQAAALRPHGARFDVLLELVAEPRDGAECLFACLDRGQSRDNVASSAAGGIAGGISLTFLDRP